ncbi:MAG: dihydrofolate reductase family protein [Gemmatimonadaceae bacterium]|nr:dihydrofolate reductase family protein [Gemmatimonadaceae bacterium]
MRISGGAETIREYLDAGHIEELTLHIAPVVLGDGLRLLDRLDPAKLKLEQIESSGSPLVTHVSYRVLR